MRALVSIFAALLILISLYQLSFTWFVNGFEKEQQQKAEQHIKRFYPAAAKKYPGDKDAQAAYQDTLDNLTNNYSDSLLRESKDKVITWWGQSYQKSK
jgi:SecD/SecF fusion protein